MHPKHDPDERACLLTHLALLTMEDGVLTPVEKELLYRHRETLELDADAFARCLADAVDHRPPPPPAGPEERAALFGYLLDIAACDGLGQKERAYLRSLAASWGLDPHAEPRLREDGRGG